MIEHTNPQSLFMRVTPLFVRRQMTGRFTPKRHSAGASENVRDYIGTETPFNNVKVVSNSTALRDSAQSIFSWKVARRRDKQLSKRSRFGKNER
jgi:hypothetical protein